MKTSKEAQRWIDAQTCCCCDLQAHLECAMEGYDGPLTVAAVNARIHDWDKRHVDECHIDWCGAPEGQRLSDLGLAEDLAQEALIQAEDKVQWIDPRKTRVEADGIHVESARGAKAFLAGVWRAEVSR